MSMVEKEAQAINVTDTDSSRPLCFRSPFFHDKFSDGLCALYGTKILYTRSHILGQEYRST